MRGPVTMSDASTLSRSPRFMTAKDNKWRSQKQSQLEYDHYDGNFFFGRTPTTNLSFLACQTPFSILRALSTMQDACHGARLMRLQSLKNPTSVYALHSPTISQHDHFPLSSTP